MIFDFSKMTFSDAYRFMIGAIVPRPIAWVSTCSKEGVGNLAPFSFFNGVCSNPPSLVFSIVRKADGSKKDTLLNIESTSEFVVNIAHADLAENVDETSEAHPYGVDELKLEGLTPLPSTRVKPVRVAEAKIHMECKLLKTVEIGAGGAGSSTLVIGEIVCAHVEDSLVGDKNRIDFVKLDPLARLGGKSYGRGFKAFEIN